MINNKLSQISNNTTDTQQTHNQSFSKLIDIDSAPFTVRIRATLHICILSGSVNTYIVLKVDVRARRQQELDSLHMAVVGSNHQCRLPQLCHKYIHTEANVKKSLINIIKISF